MFPLHQVCPSCIYNEMIKALGWDSFTIACIPYNIQLHIHRIQHVSIFYLSNDEAEPCPHAGEGKEAEISRALLVNRYREALNRCQVPSYEYQHTPLLPGSHDIHALKFGCLSVRCLMWGVFFVFNFTMLSVYFSLLSIALTLQMWQVHQLQYQSPEQYSDNSPRGDPWCGTSQQYAFLFRSRWK